MQVNKTRLSELLVQHNLITKEQLEKVLAKQREEGGKLRTLLLSMGYVEEDVLLNFLAKQWHIPLIDLKRYPLNIELSQQLSEVAARQFQAILLEEKDRGLLVGMVDPQDIIAFDEISRLLQRPIYLALVRESDLLSCIDAIYRHTEEITTYAKELSAEVKANHFDIAELMSPNSDAQDAPVVKLLQSLFRDAVRMKASDIHIEPDENVLRIRQRIDGVLQENIMHETKIAPALASRLKLMAGLKIAEKRLPQDGRFSVTVHNRNIDVRLSSMPVQHGESIVMRLLDRATVKLKLDQLGIPQNILTILQRLIQLPHGMVLITGPTGSGKTSTLYSMLNELNTPGRKIITVEDPVEYHLARVNQVQVNAQIGLTFSHVLRAALRQDPDILMVGEIRDKETANIALNAAMTGHFVLATMHTNDAISSAIRLMEMGNESYIVSSALRAVISQRLLRKNCENCLTTYQPDTQEIAWLTLILGKKQIEVTFKRGAGCAHCYHTGYKGRVPTFELFEVHSEIAAALRDNDLAKFSQAIYRTGYTTLMENALSLAIHGVTTLQEVVRVAADLSSENIHG